MLVYLITNIHNGKQYVGQTSKTLNSRWGDHVYSARTRNHTLLGQAINKYGKEKFHRSILHACDSKEECNFVEIFYIALLETKVPFGYNKSDGGECSRAGCRKLVCFRGHEFTLENTYFDSRGVQVCRACKLIWHHNNKPPLTGLHKNQNTGITRCKRGHEFTEENTKIKHVNGKIHRSCKSCEKIRTMSVKEVYVGKQS